MSKEGYAKDLADLDRNLQGAWDRLDKLEDFSWFFLQQRIDDNGGLVWSGSAKAYTLNELSEQFFRAKSHPELSHEFEGVQDYWFSLCESLVKGVRAMLVERMKLHLEMAVSVQQMHTLVRYLASRKDEGEGGS